MTIISPDEYDLLMSLSGYEQNLQATNIGNKYGLISVQSNHRFEYDPSPDASQRRQQVSQAINCPGCGAALGIPSIRPIKVTCPQCYQENTFLE